MRGLNIEPTRLSNINDYGKETACESRKANSLNLRSKIFSEDNYSEAFVNLQEEQKQTIFIFTVFSGSDKSWRYTVVSY